jgi:hypothetical protein
MSFIDFAKSILNLEPPKPLIQLVTVSAFDPEELPFGFFNVLTASGKESLGYRGSFVTYDCGETVVDGARRITLDKKRDELPTVKLDYRSQGSNAVNGRSVIDTEQWENDGEVSWTGVPPSSGVQLR